MAALPSVGPELGKGHEIFPNASAEQEGGPKLVEMPRRPFSDPELKVPKFGALERVVVRAYKDNIGKPFDQARAMIQALETVYGSLSRHYKLLDKTGQILPRVMPNEIKNGIRLEIDEFLRKMEELKKNSTLNGGEVAQTVTLAGDPGVKRLMLKGNAQAEVSIEADRIGVSRNPVFDEVWELSNEKL